MIGAWESWLEHPTGESLTLILDGRLVALHSALAVYLDTTQAQR